MFLVFLSIEKRDFLPALIGAGISLLMLKSGFLSFFFLVPLGFVAYSYPNRTAWLAFFMTLVGNCFLTIAYAAGSAMPLQAILWDIFYYSVMTFIFIWIIAPLPFLYANISEPARLIASSCLGSLLFSFILFKSIDSQVFLDYVTYFINSIISVYQSSGTDVVQNAMLETLTPEFVLEKIMAFMLRGGSIASCILLFFVCCQISLILARLSYRLTGKNLQGIKESRLLKKLNSLAAFHVNPNIIWVFSSSLILVVLTRIIKYEIPEIILWNILVICSILYLVQGLGIIQHFLVKPSFSPLLRLFIVIAFFFVLFSPVLNAFLLGALALLGIAENWLPLRVPKQSGPPSTPEAGGGES
jgi:hypothetical protein